jgi:hypothetical protein
MLNYGWVYPQALLIFTITLVYSVVSPLILWFGAIYFGVACKSSTRFSADDRSGIQVQAPFQYVKSQAHICSELMIISLLQAIRIQR